MTSPEIDVSFVIPAKNEEQFIVQCIKSLQDCSDAGVTTEICVVDNGSTDGTVGLAHTLNARVIEHPNLSISALRNVGAMASTGKWIAFVDADVTVAPDWLENALREIRLPEVAAVGSSPDIPSGSNWVVRTWHLQVVSRPDYCEREWLASMNMLVRRDLFEQIGGFDETLTTCEDVDLGYRITRLYRIIYDKRIRATHHGEAQSLRQLFRKEAWRGSYNYRGLLRHGWRASEIPSLVQPLLTIGGFLCIFANFAVDLAGVTQAGILMLAAFPLAKTFQIIQKTGARHSFFALVIVWTIYSFARAWSAIVEFKYFLIKLIKPVLQAP